VRAAITLDRRQRDEYETHRGTHTGWVLAVTFSIIGLIDAIVGEILAIIGFDIFLIPATIWIVTSIALLAILDRATRERAAARSEA
jgi:hypothetical protein